MQHHTSSPARVAETVRSLYAGGKAQLQAYWVAIGGSWDRRKYARELDEQFVGLPIVSLIITDERFDNPNATMADLARILERNKQQCLETLTGARPPTGRFALVLLARTMLSVTQSSSPVTLPDWVPSIGGLNVACYIQDLSLRVDVPLNAEELRLQVLHRRLYALEQALIRRLEWVYDAIPDAHGDLFSRLARPRDPAWAAVLAEAKMAAGKVKNIDDYRPSVREGTALVSRLWNVVAQRPATEIVACAKALSRALALSVDGPLPPWRMSLLGLLGGRDLESGPSEVRFALNMLSVIAGASEYLMCAAHSERHQRYPDALLRPFVDEMCRSLTELEQSIVGLDTAWQPMIQPVTEGTYDGL